MLSIANSIDTAVLELRPPATPPAWRRLAGAGLSAALLVALVVTIRDAGGLPMRQAVPKAPAFWIAFALYYLALPASEWLIYRRLWNLPPSGFLALLRKLVSNEILLGYSGELSFYLYARRHGALRASPFHAIKDVSILSALAGNLATMTLAALAWPIWQSWRPGVLPSGTEASLAGLALATLLLLLLRRRLFSLPAPTLRFIAAVHLARIAVMTLLLGLMWTAALPQVPIAMWIALAALQLVVGRLPFVPSKDIVFAGVALFLLGAHSPVGELLALVASLQVATHLVVAAGLVAVDLIGRGEHL